MNWFRWYTGTATDPKFLVVARLSGQNVAAVVAVWAMLLERASDGVTQCDAVRRGLVTGFDCESADVLLGLDSGASDAILTALRSKGLLSGDEVTNWKKRQPKREDSSAERTRAYRERLKEKQAVTQCDAPVTQCDARREENREDINTFTPISNDISVNVAQAGRKPSSSDVLIGKRKRLEGKRKASFEKFWETFGYKKGRAEAIDAWAAIPQLTDALMEQILSAARKEAERRPEIQSAGRTPIYAQGWITGRRWEDEELSEAPRRRPEYLTNPNFGR